MHTEQTYAAVLTGAAFLLYEFKQVVQLKAQGMSDREIREKVVSDNVFQYEKISSAKRTITSLLRRVNALDDTLRRYALEGSHETVKGLNLYAIMKTDRLFREFMDEVIQEKWATDDYNLEKKELNTYFTTKAEQEEKVAAWSAQTVNKLKEVYLKILFETGILKDKASGELNRLLLDADVKDHLRRIGDQRYVQAMGE